MATVDVEGLVIANKIRRSTRSGAFGKKIGCTLVLVPCQIRETWALLPIRTGGLRASYIEDVFTLSYVCTHVRVHLGVDPV